MNQVFGILLVIMILTFSIYFSRSWVSYVNYDDKIEKLENVNSDSVNNSNISESDDLNYKPKLFNDTDIRLLNKIFPSLIIMKKEDKLTMDQINKSEEPITIIPQNTFLGLNDVIDDDTWVLPWDREVGHCEVLKNNDRDLYKTVQDVKTITFF